MSKINSPKAVLPQVASIRIPLELYPKMAALCEILPGMTLNGFGVECIREMIEMIESQEPRSTPKLVAMADALRSERPKLLTAAEKAERLKRKG